MRYSSSELRPRWGGPFASSMVNRLILANVLVFFLEFVFSPYIIQYFALTPRMMLDKFFFWQPFTYMFLHGGFWHLFFNMLMTWFLGSTLEAVWGSKRFLKYYIACGLGGAAFSMIFTFQASVIGASAAVFGLYLAYAIIFPNNHVYIYFLFPVKAKYLVTFLAIFQLAQGISGPSGIAYFAHLGGMAAGLLFFRHEIKNSSLLNRTRRRWVNYNETRREDWTEQQTVKIDSILDKIATKGYENLTTTEKRILENYSRKKKDDTEQ